MTPATLNDTEISADPKVPLIRITREFDAPPEKVFRAHTDAGLLAQWIGPRGYTVKVTEFDCRTGGSWRYEIDAGDSVETFHGSFHDVLPERLTVVQTFTYDGWPEGVALEKLVIEDLGDGRCRLVATSLCDSFEGRDAMLSSGMDKGVIEGYEKLDELLVRR